MIKKILSMAVGSLFIISTSLATAAEDIVDTAIAVTCPPFAIPIKS